MESMYWRRAISIIATVIVVGVALVVIGPEASALKVSGVTIDPELFKIRCPPASGWVPVGIRLVGTITEKDRANGGFEIRLVDDDWPSRNDVLNKLFITIDKEAVPLDARLTVLWNTVIRCNADCDIEGKLGNSGEDDPTLALEVDDGKDKEHEEHGAARVYCAQDGFSTEPPPSGSPSPDDYISVEFVMPTVILGNWNVAIGIDPQEASFADSLSITSVLTLNYVIGDLIFTSVTDLTENGWRDQTFSVAGMLGAFTIASDLVFDPDVPEFTSWGIETGVSIAGISFDVTFELEDKDATLVLGVAGVAGDVTVGVDVTLGGDDNDVCDLNWGGIVIDIGFPFCCGDIGATLAFDCDGFDYVELTTGGIAIPTLPWLSIDAVLTFTMQTKSLVLSPSVDFGDIACFDIDIEVIYVGGDMEILSIDSLLLEGISLTCDIGAVTFTGASTFGTPLYKGIYWEYYSIETNDDACCGPFAFDLTFYFLEGGAKLFDVALIDANMSLQVSSHFTFEMGLELNVETGAFTEWTLGFLVEW